MIAGERLLDEQGNEVCLFPLSYLNVSNGEHNLYAIDFLGWDSEGRVNDCPCYAPFSGSVHSTEGTSNNMIYWSDNPVRLVDGRLSNISILVAHSNTAPPSIGDHFQQGDLFYHTGNAPPSTGDHLHLEVALGHVGWDSTYSHLDNPDHVYDVMAINDTIVINDDGYNFRDYQIIIPISGLKTHFKWVLYANKLRKERYINE